MKDQVQWAGGWEAFFRELATFLCQLDREEGITNQQFLEYALEQLGLAILFEYVIITFCASENDQCLREAILYYMYLSVMDELNCWCVYSLYGDKLDRFCWLHSFFSQCQSPTIHTGQRGGPIFNDNNNDQ